MAATELAMQERSIQPNIGDLWELLGRWLSVLWKDWPMSMTCTTFSYAGKAFSFTGDCPHCRSRSAFLTVSSTVETKPETLPVSGLAAILQCQGCKRFILGIVGRYQGGSGSAFQNEYTYTIHYPVGFPDDKAAEEIPAGIKENFQEALRCLWVNSYNATAEMCRRAVEGSCIQLGAPRSKKKLEDKIDWLAEKGTITPFMAQVAHKITLGGNRGAHFPNLANVSEGEWVSSDEGVIGKEQAEAIIKFTRELFHHVYVVPRELEKYDFSKSSGEKT
jgi:hypothetical protein